MFKIRTYNKISPKGLERFSAQQYETGPDVGHPDAVLLRSHKLHDEAIPATLLAVARAGAGVNNLPVQEYSRRGIVAFNTPGANANAVKELVMAGMLLSSRDILGGRRFVDELTLTDESELSSLLEAEKKRFAGRELKGKVLGVVGLGAIGSMVAEMALAMGMQVVGYDPALSVEAAWRLPSQVQRKENLAQLLQVSDYVSLHVPALDVTRHMINAESLAAMKQDAALVNFARDAIVDDKAVLNALDAGKLRQYICDFPVPAMRGRNDVIALPHIGASTEEAEDNCAIMAAEQLCDFLENGNITNSVNFPHTSLGRVTGCCRMTFSNDNVSGVLGHVLSIFADHNVNVMDMVNKSRGELAYNILDLAARPGDDVVQAIGGTKHVKRVRVIPG